MIPGKPLLGVEFHDQVFVDLGGQINAIRRTFDRTLQLVRVDLNPLGGTALRGKRLLCAVTAGGTEDAYRTSGFNHYTIRELLRPIEQTATLCGMVYLPPYALFGSRTALDDGRVDAHVDNWRRILDCLLHDRIDIAMAEKAEKLNECVAPPDGESA